MELIKTTVIASTADSTAKCEAMERKMSSLERNELLRTVKRLGRTIWKKWSAIIGEVWLKPRCIASNYWG